MTPSWRLKIDRAQEHLKEVDAKVATYRKTHSYRAVRAKNLKGEQHIWRYELEVADQPDPMLAVVLAEVVHGARSALDHIAVALVPAERNRQASFPIYLEDPHRCHASGQLVDAKARARFESAIEGASVEAKALIEGFQPYNAGEPFFDSLGVISRIDNADKHSALAVVMQGIVNPEVTVTARGLSREISQPGPGMYEHSAAIAELDLAHWRGKPLKESEVQVKVSGAVEVAVAITTDEETLKATGTRRGGVVLPDALARAIIEVTEVLDALEPHVL